MVNLIAAALVLLVPLFAFDLPKGWTAETKKDGAVLAPPEAAQGGESYGVLSRGAIVGVKSLAEPGAVAFFDADVSSFAPGVTRTAAPEALEHDGVRLVYEGPATDLKPIKAVVLARPVGDRVVWIFAVGLKEKVEAREGDLRRIYETLRSK
jgi:hypothetical protein